MTREPELRHTPSGKSVCQFSLAVDRAGDMENGEAQSGFFDVDVWDRQGENCAQYLVKGQQVAVNGRLRHRRWEANDGTKRSAVSITAFNVTFLAKPGEGRGDGQQQLAYTPTATPASSPSEDIFGAPVSSDEDIPFEPTIGGWE